MSKTFLTVCTTDKYLEGVLVLNKSIELTKSKYKLTVLLTKDASITLEKKIVKNGIKVMRIDRDIDLPNEVIEKNRMKGFSHWNNTLQKLCIFELEQFDKIVYLDSDMILLQNIDELFNRPHMSAVIAGKSYPGNEHWTKLNSGCMVIEPQKGLLDEFINIIPEVCKQRQYFGDQDILQVYYNDWEDNNELILNEKYNVFHGHVDYYINNLNYDIAIVHFIGELKPWMMSNLQIIKRYMLLIRYRKIEALKLLITYRKILKKVRHK